MSDQNINTLSKESGLVTLSWHSLTPVNLNGKQVVRMQFSKNVHTHSDLSVQMTSDITIAEAYVNGKAIGLDLRGNEKVTGLSLAQNIPNPWSRSTSINFELERAGEVKISVYDALGRQIVSHFDNYSSSLNQYELTSEKFEHAGVYTVEVTYGGYSEVIRILHIK